MTEPKTEFRYLVDEVIARGGIRMWFRSRKTIERVVRLTINRWPSTPSIYSHAELVSGLARNVEADYRTAIDPFSMWLIQALITAIIQIIVKWFNELPKDRQPQLMRLKNGLA